MKIVKLDDKRPPVEYMIRVQDYYNDDMAFQIEGIAMNKRSRRAVRFALKVLRKMIKDPKRFREVK